MVDSGLDKHEEALAKLGWLVMDTSNDTIERSGERIRALIGNSAG